MNSKKQKPFIALFLALCTITLFSGCGGQGKQGAESAAKGDEDSEDLRARAAQLAQEILIVDTHVDVPYRLFEEMEDISQSTEKGDFDYPRAKAGGLNAPFMSIYIPADLQMEPGQSKAHGDLLIDMVEKFTTDWPDQFAIARSPSDLEVQFSQGLISLPLGMENGSPVEGDLANLQHFFDRGIRYITLTHAKNNHICDSSYELADNRKWKGLSPFGHQVVAEMNRLGIMVDISHVSDDAFHQVMEITKAPAIASHSSCRHFTPDFERNMDDEMIKALAANGGVIQINFGSSFLKAEIQVAGKAQRKIMVAYAEENGLTGEDEEMQAFIEKYRQDNPPQFADLADVIDHIDHVVKLVGIDHVGLGSDFDGVGDSLPSGLKDVSDYPNIIHALLEKGYSEEDIRKVCGGNVLRVWRTVEKVAAELQASS
jgi:membrane dipeptidase